MVRTRQRNLDKAVVVQMMLNSVEHNNGLKE